MDAFTLSHETPYGRTIYVLERENGAAYSLAEVVTLGSNVRDVRTRAGYKQQGEAAKALGWAQSRLSDIEGDRYGSMDSETLLHIAITFNASVEDLLVGTNTGYDAQRIAAASGHPGALSPDVSDREVLTKLLALWPLSLPRAHAAALEVMQSYPPRVLPPTNQPQDTPSSSENERTARNSSGRKRGA